MMLGFERLIDSSVAVPIVEAIPQCFPTLQPGLVRIPVGQNLGVFLR